MYHGHLVGDVIILCLQSVGGNGLKTTVIQPHSQAPKQLLHVEKKGRVWYIVSSE